MLAKLYIQNVALIQKAEIDFSDGFNVFTGETGAGKTMLINAINAVLGERTSKDIIRAGENKAVISALFSELSDEHLKAIEAFGYDSDDGCLLITREIGADSKSACRINGQPATTSILKSVASLLIDIHGQHENQRIMQSDRHMDYIDRFGGLCGLRDKYRELFGRLASLKKELSDCRLDETQKAQRIDMLSYQINEIEQAALSDGEEETLNAQRKMIKDSEKLTALFAQLRQLFDGQDDKPGIMRLIAQALPEMETLGEYVPEMEQMNSTLTGISYELEAIRDAVFASFDGDEYDPRQLDRIEERLDLIYRLKRKYGGNIGDILDYYEKAARELEGIMTSEARISKLNGDIEAACEAASVAAEKLSLKRVAAAAGFIQKVSEELEFLDMPLVRLTVKHSKVDLRSDGMDEIEFLISTNPGEPPKPISKIASGGEISRIMLALKNVIADKDDIQTSIFDEIDSGVGGRAAQKIGRKLQQASGARQVICITHLAQVAAFAKRHFLIKKRVANEKTYTDVTVLDRAARVDEIARILSGEVITGAARKNAAELLVTGGN